MFNGGGLIMLEVESLKGLRMVVTEVVSLMEKGHVTEVVTFNGGRIVMLQKWSL